MLRVHVDHALIDSPDRNGEWIAYHLHRSLLINSREYCEDSLLGIVRQTRDGKTWDLALRRDAYWSNGERLTSDEVVGHLNDTAAHAARVAGITWAASRGAQGTVRLVVQGHAPHLEAVLTSKTFSPRARHGGTSQSTGQYRVVSATSHAVNLVRVAHAQGPPSSQDILFAAMSSGEAVDGLREGTVDVLCPSSYFSSADPVVGMHNRSSFKSPVVTVVVSGKSAAALRDPSERAELLCSLDHDRIATSADHWADAEWWFTSLDATRNLEPCTAGKPRRGVRLTLRYSEFEPNPAIAREIQSQLEERGYRVLLEEVSYRDCLKSYESGEFDLLLVHVSPSFNELRGYIRPLLAQALRHGHIQASDGIAILKLLAESRLVELHSK